MTAVQLPLEGTVEKLNEDINVIQQEELEATKRKEEAEAVAAREKRFVDELRLEKAKLEQKPQYKKRLDKNRKPQTNQPLGEI